MLREPKAALCPSGALGRLCERHGVAGRSQICSASRDHRIAPGGTHLLSFGRTDRATGRTTAKRRTPSRRLCRDGLTQRPGVPRPLSGHRCGQANRGTATPLTKPMSCEFFCRHTTSLDRASATCRCKRWRRGRAKPASKVCRRSSWAKVKSASGPSALGTLIYLGTSAPWPPHMEAWSGAPTPVQYVHGRSRLEVQGALVLQNKQCRQEPDAAGGDRPGTLHQLRSRRHNKRLFSSWR